MLTLIILSPDIRLRVVLFTVSQAHIAGTRMLTFILLSSDIRRFAPFPPSPHGSHHGRAGHQESAGRGRRHQSAARGGGGRLVQSGTVS